MRDPIIRLLPEEGRSRQQSRSPYHRAIRWTSQFEGQLCAEPAVDVFMTQKAYIRVCAQAGSDLENEVGGWLVGRHRSDCRGGRDFVVVEKILTAQKTDHSGTHFTFTQDSMVELHQTLESDHPGKQILGWYHSHPRMGVFLSGMDEWLHLNFFPETWQVALVIEPHSQSGGFFIQRKDDRLDTHDYYGFYELNNGIPYSVVHWKNLTTDCEATI